MIFRKREINVPYETESPLAAAFGAASGFLQGQQQAKRQKRQDEIDDETRRNQALANGYAFDLKKAQLEVNQENADWRSKNAAAVLGERTRNDDLVSKGKGDAQRETMKRSLMNDATRRFAIAQTAIRNSANLGERRFETLAHIHAAHEDVRARIVSGELRTKEQVDAAYARIDAMVQNNIRTTSTSAANNERTVGGALQRTGITEGGKNLRNDANNAVRLDLGEFGGDVRKYGIDRAAATARRAQDPNAAVADPKSPSLIRPAQNAAKAAVETTLGHARDALKAGVPLAKILAKLRGMPLDPSVRASVEKALTSSSSASFGTQPQDQLVPRGSDAAGPFGRGSR